MSIFEIITLAALIGVMVFLIYLLVVSAINDFDDLSAIAFIAGCIVWIGVTITGTFIGILINTEYERGYVNRYKAQKATIEMSLECEELSGLERIELVNKAVELNGEFAERKTQYDRWDYVCYDNSLYDGLDIINLK